MTSNAKLPIWIMVVVVCAVAIATIEAQEIPSCATNLLPCFAFMNATSPPPSCCTPLKQIIDTQMQCLCNLFFNDPGLLPSLGINLAEALTLPARCGINISSDLSACVQSPGSSTTPPSADKNVAERIAGSAGIVVGLVAIFFLLF